MTTNTTIDLSTVSALATEANANGGCPACGASLHVTATRASGPHLVCRGSARHAFDVRASDRRGNGRTDGVPVRRDAPCTIMEGATSETSA